MSIHSFIKITICLPPLMILSAISIIKPFTKIPSPLIDPFVDLFGYQHTSMCQTFDQCLLDSMLALMVSKETKQKTKFSVTLPFYSLKNKLITSFPLKMKSHIRGDLKI